MSQGRELLQTLEALPGEMFDAMSMDSEQIEDVEER